MGSPSTFRFADRARLRMDKREAARDLPAAWLPPIDAEARAVGPFWRGARGESEVWRRWLDEYGGAQAADLSDSQIKAQAEAYALEARALDLGEQAEARPWHEFVRILDFCAARNVEPPPVGLLLSGIASRVRCPYWWRRALRRMVARRCERGAMALGLVCKPKGQPYASNAAVWRRVDQNARNARAAQAICFENDAGQVATLAELSARSTSNKAIRRGELMTRIRGCEEMADECGHVGLFVTLTNPSRFHATLRDGRRNPRHDGSTPRDGQARLCLLWGRARAKLAREGIGIYGFRVAEPHHDGCVHWHALFWVETEAQAARVEEVLWGYWLSDDGRWDSPSVPEPGALKYRVNIKRMERGGAAGYVAKYIAKNIDDAHIDGVHLDDYAEGEIRPDLLGDLTITPSMRVEAWAATWSIRQFQPIGQPPVGVWRELRRIKEAEARAAGFRGTIHRAWLAAQKTGGVNASWALYVKAQGGLMRGRQCHIRVRCETYECEGMYGRAPRRVPVGVALNLPGCAATVWSNRRLWRPIESSEATKAKAEAFAAQRAAPRTRVNNCTVRDDADAIRADFLRGQGGAKPEIQACPDESSSPRWRGKTTKQPPAMEEPAPW